jgi:hypothetical protein
MLPGKYNMTMFRGDTFSIAITRASAAGVPINFQTQYIDKPAAGNGSCVMTIRPGWKIRPETKKQTPLAVLSTALGTITVVGETITVTIPAGTTEDYSFNEGVYDIEIRTGDIVPVVHKVLYGRITIKDEQSV